MQIRLCVRGGDKPEDLVDAVEFIATKRKPPKRGAYYPIDGLGTPLRVHEVVMPGEKGHSADVIFVASPDLVDHLGENCEWVRSGHR
jgi:hypothetical protein